MLGIVDSGLGGLTVLRGVRAALPDEDVVFLADQANVPYGDRSPTELAAFLARNVAHLEALGVDAIVMGCNTSCAVAAELGWPVARVPLLDLIAAAASDVAATGAASVGVVATAAATRLGAYGRMIRARSPGVRVVEVAAPALVPLVEAGVLEGPAVDAALGAVRAAFDAAPDVLVLACTHYPLLRAAFARAFGERVTLVDPAVAQAARAVAFARDRDVAFRPTGQSGATLYLTTGAVDPFARAVASIVAERRPHDRVMHVTDALAGASDRTGAARA